MINSLFQTYFQLGWQHILDPAGYDHIAFLIALCAVYRPAQWKTLIWLATAFTLGHSLTLALAGLDLVRIPASWVEFAIPITIFLTALWNVLPTKKASANHRYSYLLALAFGLIHGLGFSNFLRSTLFPGEEQQLVWQLLAFNLGIEFGQLLIVAGIWLITIFAFRILKTPPAAWNLFVSGMAAGIAVTLILP